MSDHDKKKVVRWVILGLVLVAVLGAGAVYTVNTAFPKTKCEAFEHLKRPDAVADCYECHKKVTPKVAQDWFESKHGVILVKCFVCHGQPDQKGSIPFAAKPDIDLVCKRCHEPAIVRMENKFGLGAKCYDCHPLHQNSMHHDAYKKTESKKTID